MSQIPENVRQDLLRLVPSSLIQEIACFVFYDNHPRDERNIDITICTLRGEIKEFFHRDLVSSILIENCPKGNEIKILRNSKCELFYLVASDEQITILSRKTDLVILKRIYNVDYYEYEDINCRGQACLKIVCKDDAIPKIFDDDFVDFGDKAAMLSGIHADDSQPILTQLQRKLTEAKYSVKCNEKTYKDLLSLRQIAAYSSYQKVQPNFDDSLFKTSTHKEAVGGLKIESQTPWVKLCNKKLVILINVLNSNIVSIDDVHVLLHCSMRPSIVYTTRLYEKIPESPFWKENPTQSLPHDIVSTIAVTIDLKEIQRSVISRIEFDGVISYRKLNEEFLLPFENVTMTALDTMGEEFNVLCSNQVDAHSIILATLATTERTDLVLRCIKTSDDSDIMLLDTFCEFLGMERIENTGNIVMHKKSTFHILNGVMIMLQEDSGSTHDKFKLTVYARSPSQVLALIHFIHDAFPGRIIVTTQNQMITAKHDTLSKHNEQVPNIASLKSDYTLYAHSILEQIELILAYFDSCMIKMNESKDSAVLSKVGTEIDLFVNGAAAYLEFRNNLLKAAFKGFKCLDNESSDVVVII